MSNYFIDENMSRRTDHLIIVNLLQVGVEWISKASSDKVSLGVVGKTLHVELALKILESKSVVQDGGISSRWDVVVQRIRAVALYWRSDGEASGQDWNDCEVTHDDESRRRCWCLLLVGGGERLEMRKRREREQLCFNLKGKGEQGEDDTLPGQIVGICNIIQLGPFRMRTKKTCAMDAMQHYWKITASKTSWPGC